MVITRYLKFNYNCNFLYRNKLNTKIDCQNELYFKDRSIENKNLLSIYIEEKISLNILPIDANTPLFELMKTINFEKNTIIFMPNYLKKTSTIKEKKLLYCFGEKGIDIFKKEYSNIIKNKPKVTSCYLENLKKLGFNEIQEWIDSNPQENIYIGRNPSSFIKDSNGNKKRMKIKESISPLAVPRLMEKEKNIDHEYFEKCYLKYLDLLFETGKIDIKCIAGKNLGCWCKQNQKCNCDLIKEKYIEKSLNLLIS